MVRPTAVEYHAGDVLAFSGRGAMSRVIRAGTCGPYSHCAIVAQLPKEDHRLVVFESTSQSSLPCLIAGEPVSGVQCHEIAEVIRSHNGGWLFSLNSPLDLIESRLLSAWCDDQIGSGYDFSDAIAARTAGFGWLQNAVARWCGCASDDSDVICSDLVASAVHEVNRYPIRRDHVSPSRLARQLLKRGTVSPGRWVTA